MTRGVYDTRQWPYTVDGEVELPEYPSINQADTAYLAVIPKRRVEWGRIREDKICASPERAKTAKTTDHYCNLGEVNPFTLQLLSALLSPIAGVALTDEYYS